MNCDLHVDLAAVVAAYRRRCDELMYENALLAAAVEQVQAQPRGEGNGCRSR
ncbi:hypothetical protein [Nonomuraea basaltis]|uniref:hypothetical protein n=1 Tax=Nonomuraea basaltis TaxID=2495887 RepID=UPI00148754AE|nr:hypothetical protein [Nonomuraea basaltis]